MKLEGVRVLDMSLFLPGPHMTMMMADHGADVIKVEPPGGEPVREVGLKQAGVSTWFRNTHRGKRCIVLDLKSDTGKAAFTRLVEWADVVVEAFRPGVAQRLGIDYDSCKAINPKIVYCSISAFGQTGPKVQRPAHDLAMQADSGVVSLNRAPDGTPAMPHMPVADMAGSLMIVEAADLEVTEQLDARMNQITMAPVYLGAYSESTFKVFGEFGLNPSTAFHINFYGFDVFFNRYIHPLNVSCFNQIIGFESVSFFII